MTQSPLAGRTALVTGGARGIGRGICLRLAREGIKVAVNYHSSESEARETAQQIEEMGSAAYTIQADVASKQAVDAMVEEVSEQLGPIDLLVNNAG
ncbi:MAG: SDR family NAD(P)-dependent oxidoreductase, partial [Pirellulaceae bacterium]|nr:SDR family NAD(P)-dependent oxidoreductase [Pirellulaceae bacterium]